MTVFITVAELAAELDSIPPRILDVRWTLAETDGREAFADGHIPGAVYADLETELSDHTVAGAGRHPLPTRETLQAAARGWGLDDGEAVVVYDDWNGLAAARAWWLLRHAGLRDVRILSGGLKAWRAAGLSLEKGEVAVEQGFVTLDWDAMPTLTADEAAAFPSNGVLLDARAGERYRGETEPIDPRAGHIPGAVSSPTTENVGPDGCFLSPGLLLDRFAALGVDADSPVAVYCGSGVNAAHEIAALEAAGISAALFPGSWSQWSSDPSRPVAVGEA
jgi:thiosulfate/3-mercaptopyruvate sulfurtransferase